MKTLLMLALSLCASAALAEPRRFALVIGTNDGDASELPLRYAEEDAQRFRDVLVEVGGAQQSDVSVLFHPTADQVLGALDALDARLRARHTAGDQLVVYLSGHADAGSVHLGGTHLELHTLTERLRHSPASVALLILDSCRSGSATHVKGLEPIEGTRVNVELPDVRGRVIIGSSGADEYAQESDQLEGSFFTHHLIAGLRGAADTSHDGVITLQEAYSYAYALTVESTFGTRGGVQHPSFSVDLHGEGDLVLSEPVHARGKLRIAVAAPGEWLVYTARGRNVIGQFEKPEGDTVLAIAPGTYRVIERTTSGYVEQLAEVPDGGEAVIRERDLAPSHFAPTTRKGAATAVRMALGGSLGSGITREVQTSGGIALWADAQHPFDLALPLVAIDLGARTASASGKLAYREESLELRAGPGLLLQRSGFSLGLALVGGELLVRQADLAGDSGAPGFAPELGLSPRLRLPLVGPLELAATAFGGAADVLTDQGRELRARLDVQFGVGFSL